MRDALLGIGTTVSLADDDEPLRVARLRASTRLKLPDCHVLATAELTGSAVASFDERLRAIAARRGLTVLPE